MLTDLNSLSLQHLFSTLTGDGAVTRLLEAARDEDLGNVGDVTTDSIITEPGLTASATMIAREGGILAGLEVVNEIVRVFGADLRVEHSESDGDECAAGRVIARFHGPLRDILRTERTMLNLIGRLSGIATLTGRYVDAVLGTSAVVCETRKTTPGLRALEKYAVRCGGGTLHRLGLYDAVLYKDNHLAHLAPDDLASSLEAAIHRARGTNDLRFVQVEVDTLDQLESVLAMESGLVNMILLDNMELDAMRRAVSLRHERAPGILLEASGGVTLESVRAIAETGVDRVSVGALTHSAPALDIALDVT